MIVLIEELKKDGVLIKGGNLYCNSDGCAKQYRCANAIYYLSALAYKYGIIIDRAIGAPGHGKDIVDGLNAVDKQYLKFCMHSIKAAHETDLNISKVQIHAVYDNKNTSCAVEAQRLCSLNRIKGSTGYIKNAKREQKSSVKHRH